MNKLFRIAFLTLSFLVAGSATTQAMSGSWLSKISSFNYGLLCLPLGIGLIAWGLNKAYQQIKNTTVSNPSIPVPSVVSQENTLPASSHTRSIQLANGVTYTHTQYFYKRGDCGRTEPLVKRPKGTVTYF